MRSYISWTCTVAVLILLLSSFVRRTDRHIWMIGDSTMAAKKPERKPESGWGEGVKLFVKDGVRVHNHAASGRSTKSFIAEGRWKKVIDSLKKGDYVIIQFGHNDQKAEAKLHTDPATDFQDNLGKFVREARRKGAVPILCTPIVRRHFDEKGNLIDTHGEYVGATKEVAHRLKVPLVDMEHLSRSLVEALGPEASKELYVFTNRKQDSTHLSHKGAEEVAGLFVKDLRKEKRKFRRLLK